MPIDYSYLRTKEFRVGQLHLWDSKLKEKNILIEAQPAPTGEIHLGINGIQMWLSLRDIDLVKATVGSIMEKADFYGQEAIREKLEEFSYRLQHFPNLPNIPPVWLSISVNSNGHGYAYYHSVGRVDFIDERLFGRLSAAAVHESAAFRQRIEAE